MMKIWRFAIAGWLGCVGAISASTFNQGNAGNITINANQIDLRGSSSVRTQVDDQAKGNAGNISIKTQLLNIQEESQISSGTQGNGNAGNLTVQADNIILTGSDSEFATSLSSSVDERANGKGGDIDITTSTSAGSSVLSCVQNQLKKVILLQVLN